MNDVEQRLADWLKRETPEPPRVLTAEHVLASAPRPRRTWTPLLAAAVIIALIAAIAVALASTTGNRPRPAAPTVTSPVHLPAPGVTSRSAGAPQDFAAQLNVGAHDSVEWRLARALRISTDAGDHWTTVPLPAGVTRGAVTQLDLDTDGAVLLAVVRAQRIEVYHRAAGSGSWVHVTLVPQRPSVDLGGQQPQVLLRADRGVLAVFASWPLTRSAAYSDVFVSGDAGATFTQHPTGIDTYVGAAAFLDRQHGVVVAGVNRQFVYRTADGGESWHRVLGPSGRASTSWGDPALDGSAIEIARQDDVGSVVRVDIFRSTDRGSTFAASAGRPPLVVRADPSVAFRAAIVWVSTASRIHRSGDGGVTWTSTATALPVRVIAVVSAERAVGLASADCSSNDPTAQCASTDYLVETTDGGRTWSTQ